MEHPAYSELRPVTSGVGVVLCPNPGYASLEGTNSWVIRAPADEYSIVVDPGPEDEGHLNVLHRKADKVALILLTHRHGDHADGAQRFRQLTGAPVRSFDPAYCIDAPPLQDGEIIKVAGVTPTVEVVHTPGHTADSTSFFIHEAGELTAILTGDTIAGRHTTMISETDGNLADYLRSLALLEQRGKDVRLCPGHGPDGFDVASFAKWYIERREQRLVQIKEARDKLGTDASIKELVDAIYDDVDPVLRDAAEQSTRVALRYLETQAAS